jgi:hypothetical protein
VVADEVGDGGGESDLAAGGGGLGFTAVDQPFDLGEGVGDGEGAAEQVEVVEVEGGEFAPSQSGVGGGDDEGVVAGVDGVGEVGDLIGPEESHLGRIEAGKSNPANR